MTKYWNERFDVLERVLELEKKKMKGGAKWQIKI
jgi:hypothetical protein